MGQEYIEDTNVDQFDQACTLLRSSRTRRMLFVLADRKVPISLADLATDIAMLEEEQNGHRPDADLVYGIYVSLHHVDLPKLESYDVVSYDEGQHTVTLNESIELTNKLLQVMSCLGMKRLQKPDSGQFA